MKKVSFSDVGTALLVACAVVVTALVVRREMFSGPAEAQPVVRQIEDGLALGATGSVLGDAAAPLRIVEFSDFQCPYCAQVHGELKDLRRKHGERVAVVYRHLPLTRIHPHAVAAAVAAECAAEQGRFEPFHDALFLQQDSIGTKSWDDFARTAGVPDLKEFGDCVAAERFRARVEEDVEAARKAEISGTPTFVFEGKVVAGAVAMEHLDRWVDEALEAN
jgi:protein-disulfide isomerase